MGGKVASSRENRVNKGRREESKGCVGAGLWKVTIGAGRGGESEPDHGLECLAKELRTSPLGGHWQPLRDFCWGQR